MDKSKTISYCVSIKHLDAREEVLDDFSSLASAVEAADKLYKQLKTNESYAIYRKPTMHEAKKDISNKLIEFRRKVKED